MTSKMNDTKRWWSIVGVLVGLELRQRLRTTRWKATLAIAFAALTLIVLGSLYVATGPAGTDYRDWAQNLFAVVMAAELFLGIVLAPTLSATAINGDRKDATLAVVQATPISNWQLAIGKLVGNWVSCLALVAVAAPYLIWGIIEAPYGIWTSVLAVLVLCLLFACYCGIGLGFSALTARPAGSAVLTQAAVFFLVLGLPAIFGVLYSTTAQEHRVMGTEYTASENPSEYPTCRDVEETETFNHTERIWWLLAPNPLLLLPDVVAGKEHPREGAWFADSGPKNPTVVYSIAGALSTARTGPYIAAPTCSDHEFALSSEPTPREPSYYEARETHERSRIGDSWYLGLLVNAVFGGIGLTIAARRLRVPAGKLPKGVRIA